MAEAVCALTGTGRTGDATLPEHRPQGSGRRWSPLGQELLVLLGQEHLHLVPELWVRAQAAGTVH